MNTEQNDLVSKILAGVALLFAALAAWRFVEAFSIQKKIDTMAMFGSGLNLTRSDVGAPSVMAQWGVPVVLLIVAVGLGIFAVKRLKRA